MADKMTLTQMRVACGLEVYQLAQLAGVSTRLIQEAEREYGNPIARVKAEKICQILSEEHGHPITLNDIKGLNIC